MSLQPSWQTLFEAVISGDVRAIARSISLVENEQDGYLPFLQELPQGTANIIGITGPPGAGKSTLTDALIGELTLLGKKVAVLCIDPSSPFNLGAVLGDRIRMSQWYNHPDVYIRSLATRGSMGGLTHSIIEITAILKAARFDHIIIETVGIGQSEVEIAGLADITVVVLVPEAGDEIQTMKAGLMEIADIFVVNKSDRPDADQFVKNLRLMLAPAFHRQQHEIAIIKTVAAEKKGVDELAVQLQQQHSFITSSKRALLLANRAWHILVRRRMQEMSLGKIKDFITGEMDKPGFNLFRTIEQINREMK